MNKSNVEKRSVLGKDRNNERADKGKARGKKLTEYGKQLEEKQRVRDMYGMRERQFKNWFESATAQPGGPGENLLSMLERRLDNVVYRLKLANTRRQARQIIAHGHVTVNKKRVKTASYLVKVSDEVGLMPAVSDKAKFVEQVVDKRLNIGVKVPDWLELKKAERAGVVLRKPARADIQTPIEEHLIVELYSK
jgi:small subunit ribosomal protein S4